jgi:hypothetical protein
VKPQSKHDRSFGKTLAIGFVQTRESGKMNSDSPLKVRWVPDSQHLQKYAFYRTPNCRRLIFADLTDAYVLRLAARRVF